MQAACALTLERESREGRVIENREEKFGTLRKGGENVGNCTFRMQISNDPRDDLPFFSAEIERADGLRRPPPRNDNIYVYIYI